MATDPPPTWPIEPTTLFIFLHYPTNGLNEEPDYQSTMLQDFNAAIQGAKDYITAQGNIGVCIVQPITCTIVYPSVAWVDW